MALLAGCAKQPSANDNRLIITAFSSDFETKVSETTFEAGDIIGIFIGGNSANLRYETMNGVDWRGLGGVGEFRNGDKVTAYYPYSDNSANANAIAVASGVDFMICPATPITVAGNMASANLKFKHVLSKLVVSIDKTEELNGVKIVSLDSVVVRNAFRKGIIDLTTAKISSLSDKGDLRAFGAEIIVIPQTVHKIELVFKMANGEFDRLAYNEPILLESGKKTTFKATSNADLYFTSFLDLKSGEAQTNLPLSFYVAPGRTWTLTSSAAWLTIEPKTGVGAATVKVNVKANSAYPLTPRTATITLKDDKPSAAPQKAMQNCTRIPTVEIGGINWLTANLTGTTQGQTSGFTICPNPQDYGMFWKWGCKFMYDRSGNNSPSGHWDAKTAWAATAPIIPSRGYDYGNLASTWGAPVGDPCQSLGIAYKTPTQAQMQALHDAGRSQYTSYKGVNGLFLGPNASSCSDQNLINGCIFLPGGGFRSWDKGVFGGWDTNGGYWTSSVYDVDRGWDFSFNFFGDAMPGYKDERGFGLSVRCVAAAQ